MPLTIRLEDELVDESLNLNLPEALPTIIAHIQTKSENDLSGDIWDILQIPLIRVIHGSNAIESAGTDFCLTQKICRQIFKGKKVDSKLEKYNPDYQLHVDALRAANRRTSQSEVEKSRREVINHAKAFQYLIARVVFRNQPLTERLILKTHAILHAGLDDDVLAGEYRDHEVAVLYGKPNEKNKRSICMRARAVSRYMTEMVLNLQEETFAAESNGEIDPYTLAAHYHHQFVMIHPFGDGNGRMSRIIMNTLLLKYAGHVVPFGSGMEKSQYLHIVTRGQRIFNQEDMEVDFHWQTCHLEFAKFLLIKSENSLPDMWEWANE